MEEDFYMPFKSHPRPVLVQPDDPSIKLIPLTQGYVARVSAIDYDDISKWTWVPFKSTRGRKIVYAQRWGRGKGRKRIFMHKQIFPQWKEIDHEDGDGLNNVRENLRDCLHSENSANRGENSNNTSGYKGVFFHSRDNYWFSGIGINGIQTWLGRSETPIEAARKYDRAALSAFGEFAVLNFPATDYADNNLGQMAPKYGKSFRNTSGYKGVSWSEKSKKWQSEGRHEGQRFYLGMFVGTEDGKIEAARAYDRWVIEHCDSLAYTNFARSDYE
jgi:hypothetical protein